MINRFLSLVSFVLVAALLCLTSAYAEETEDDKPVVSVVIDVSSQSMSVKVNGWYYAHWKVSTARPGYHTPRGTFGVQRSARVYYSKKYDNAPMPNAVFFHYGFAIHGTYYVKNLGRPASHGCVRLSPDNSAQLFDLVEKYGLGSTRIVIMD